MAAVHIGTSGWHYKHWRGSFYPAAIAPADMLPFYCRRFATVELNNAFYRLPAEESVNSWRKAVPAGFVFSVKASRYITHMKKLKDAVEPLETFLDRMGGLRDRLGPVLFQLPPRWKRNPQRLKAFVSRFPQDHRFVLEFRDPSWYHDAVVDILSEWNVALCLHDMRGSASPKRTTADFVYVRLHGPQKYGGTYDRQTLDDWARTFSTWQRQGKSVFCYFNNDADGHAVQDALALKAMIESAHCS